MTNAKNGTDSNLPFPRPFGGIADGDADFYLSLLFNLGYTAVFCITARTFIPKRTRTISKGATLSLTFERTFATALRMLQSRQLSSRESSIITAYLQATYSAGYVSLLEELLSSILSAAIYATRDGLTFDEWIKAAEKNPGLMEVRKSERDAFRNWVTKIEWSIHAIFAFELAFAFQSELCGRTENGTWVLYFRLLGNLIGFFSVIYLLSMVHRLHDLEGINKLALRRIKLTLVAIFFIPLTRSFQSVTTSTTLSTSPLDSDTIIFKTVFYTCQLLPELIACFITSITDYRTLCDTGPWGDWTRRRVENGQPNTLSKSKILAHYFTLWRAPRLLKAYIRKIRGTHQDDQDIHMQGPLIREHSQKPSRNISRVNPEPAIILSKLDDSRSSIAALDTDKESIWTESSGFSSKQKIHQGSQASAQSSHSSLVEDINLWRPRFPRVFSL